MNKAELVVAWRRGVSLAELSRRYRLSHGVLRRLLRAQGCDTASRGVRSLDWTMIRVKYAAGATIHELAKEHQAAPSTIYRHCVDLIRSARPMYATASYLDKNGYVLVQHTGAKRRLHMVLMAIELGRPLKSGEEVHHIDGDKQNNACTNLWLFPSRAEHNKAHLSLRSAAREWVSAMGLYPVRPGRRFWGTLERVGWLLLRHNFIEFKDGRYGLIR